MTRLLVSLLGLVVGLAGIEHGVGEILQGSVSPAGLMFPSWPEAELMKVFNGEPAMSVIPNFLVSGILTVLVSWCT